MLAIWLLGTPQILQDDQPLAITRRKSRALLFYLAAHAKPLTREQLLAFFWPDSDRVSAQQVLRTTLHGLRQALGTALLVDDNTLALSSDVDIDVRTFKANLQPPTSNFQLLTSTLQLYRGDFLAGFTLNDSPEFEDWITEQQEHYRRLAIRGYIALALRHEQQQDYAAALEALNRALSFDPLQEDVQRSALRLHYLAGDRPGAIRRYEALRKLLNDEMGVPPMAETRALYDEIISDRGSGIRMQDASSRTQGAISHQPPAINTLPFTGRELELAKLHEAVTSHQLALIEGEPGIGKTRLAAEFLRAQPGLHLTSAAHELEHGLPYQPVIDALRGLFTTSPWPQLRPQLNLSDVWLAEIARLVPEAGLTPGERALAWRPVQGSLSADESRLWEGVHQFLIALSQVQSVTLFIDDVQWADNSTLGLLGYLVRVTAVSIHPIVFVAASRPIGPRTPIGALVQTLTREGRLIRIPLDRFSSSDTALLTQQISPAFAHPLAAWLMQQSEGNPYILSESINYARESGLLLADGSLNLSALSSSLLVPPSIYSLIQARLLRLSDPARRILDAAVAMGRVFEFEVVARAAAISENAALDALDELRAARLIEPQGSDGLHFAFDHSLTMEVAYREVGEPRHRLLHRRVAEAMEAIYGRQRLDAVAGLLAWHFLESGDLERAAPYALRAARLARKFAAWHEATEFYEQALLVDVPPSERAAILMELGDAHTQAGENTQASQTYRAALKLCAPQSMEADRARLALAQALLNEAQYTEAIELAQQVREAGRPEMIVNAEMQWGTTLSVEGADLIGAAEHLNQAEALLRRQADQPDAARLAQIKFEQGSVAAQQGDLEQAAALYRDTIAISVPAGLGALPFQILGYNNLAYHLHLQQDSAALEYAQQGLQLAREQGVLGLQPFLLSTLGEIELERDVAAAERYFTEGLTLAERLSMPERIAGLTANLGRVASQRGATALAIHRFSTALAKAEALGLPHLAAQIQLWLVPLLPPTEARAVLQEVRALAESTGRKRLLQEAQQLEAKFQSG
jgi:DNA-binding SARP family transcriptional activator